MQVNWTDRAKSRLRMIHSRIAENSPTKADEEIDRLLVCSVRLSELPYSGRKIPEINRDDLRELLVRPHRLMYKILANRIDVITIVHYRQHLDKDFMA